jgi:VanZ family protein
LRFERNRASAAIGWLILLALLIVGLFLGEAPEDTRVWDSVFDAGHVLLFGLITWLNFRLARSIFPRMPSRDHLAITILATLVIAVVTEIAQIFMPSRDASRMDVLRDAAGSSIFALAWLSAQKANTAPRTCRALRLSAGVIALAFLMPVMATAELYYQRDRIFPRLVQFDGSRWEQDFLVTRQAKLISNARPGLRDGSLPETFALLRLSPGVYPGFVLDEPFPDWRGFKRLEFFVYYDEDVPLHLTLRIQDRWYDGEFGDRFNREVAIHRGLQRVTIPLEDVRDAPIGRQMDLSQLRGLMLLRLQASAGGVRVSRCLSPYVATVIAHSRR